MPIDKRSAPDRDPDPEAEAEADAETEIEAKDVTKAVFTCAQQD